MTSNIMINEPRGEYSSENILIERERQRLRLEGLANSYRSERFVLSGIDEEAQENNRLVVAAIAAAGEKFRNRVNDIFAIQMGGSRIGGYNTENSDIDIVPVTPDTLHDSGFIFEIIGGKN